MYTQCPECLSVFSLEVQTFVQSHGHVICGHCGASFDGILTLTDQLPPEPFVQLPVNEPAAALPSLDLVVYRPRPAPPAVIETVQAPAESGTGDDFSHLMFAPRFAREPAMSKSRGPAKPARRKPVRSSGERNWPWVTACGLLSLLLLAQLAWAEREPLLRDPTTGSFLRSSCAALGCELPLVSAPRQLRLLASNVQVHPSVPGALMISASVLNTAPFSQPYPVLTITLSNAQGKRVAMRRLQPSEYLDDNTILRRGLAPGASAVLLLEVEDPGDKAVAFEFSFE
jgi:predicted Zn finger-like uncharacterized protein